MIEKLTVEEVRGLPQELLKELRYSSKSNKMEAVIVSIIQAGGGKLGLNHLLIGIFRKTGKVFKRNTLNAKLYRMQQKGILFPVENERGIFSTGSSK